MLEKPVKMIDELTQRFNEGNCKIRQERGCNLRADYVYTAFIKEDIFSISRVNALIRHNDINQILLHVGQTELNPRIYEVTVIGYHANIELQKNYGMKGIRGVPLDVFLLEKSDGIEEIELNHTLGTPGIDEENNTMDVDEFELEYDELTFFKKIANKLKFLCLEYIKPIREKRHLNGVSAKPKPVCKQYEEEIPDDEIPSVGYDYDSLDEELKNLEKGKRLDPDHIFNRIEKLVEIFPKKNKNLDCDIKGIYETFYDILYDRIILPYEKMLQSIEPEVIHNVILIEKIQNSLIILENLKSMICDRIPYILVQDKI